MCTRARCFFARFNCLKLSAPLVEASSSDPELLSQLIDALAGPHALYGRSLELPGISLSSLHSCFLSRRVCPSRVCQFKGSFHDSTPLMRQFSMGTLVVPPNTSQNPVSGLVRPTCPLTRRLTRSDYGITFTPVYQIEQNNLGSDAMLGDAHEERAERVLGGHVSRSQERNGNPA